MEGFWSFLKTIFIGFFIFAGLFIILLSLPKSKLRSFVLEIFGWVSAGASVVYVILPFDFLPDVLPVMGWIDDIGAVIIGLSSAIAAYSKRKKRLALQEKPLELHE